MLHNACSREILNYNNAEKFPEVYTRAVYRVCTVPTWYIIESMMENSAALDLLSLEDGGSGDSSDKARERLLAATILDSRTSLWKHKVNRIYRFMTTITYVALYGWPSCTVFIPYDHRYIER